MLTAASSTVGRQGARTPVPAVKAKAKQAPPPPAVLSLRAQLTVSQLELGREGAGEEPSVEKESKRPKERWAALPGSTKDPPEASGLLSEGHTPGDRWAETGSGYSSKQAREEPGREMSRAGWREAGLSSRSSVRMRRK